MREYKGKYQKDPKHNRYANNDRHPEDIQHGKKKSVYTMLSAVVAVIIGTIYSIFAYVKTGTLIPSAELIDGLPTFRFVDVGQGDCVLVTYQGEAVLVDAGPKSSGEKTAEYVSMYSPHVDYFFVTHPHEDHMGGAADVLKAVSVDYLVMSELVTDEEFYVEAVEAAKEQGTEIIYLTDAVQYDTGNISAQVYDLFDFFSDDYNNSSLFIKITAEDTTLLITGDAETEEEEYALEKYGQTLDCDILKVGHHGSRSSSSEEFLNTVTPEIAVISCGKNNSYGHPTSEVLKRLKKADAVIYRTDTDGTVILRGEKAV